MIDCEDVKFEHPSNWLIGAQSQGGKTYFVYQLLKIADIFKPDLPKIIYCYAEWQTLYEKMMIEINNITFMKGLPDIIDLENVVIVLDDLMSDVIENKSLLNLFTVGSHHKKISTIFLTQNIYEKGKYARTISLNCHYMVLFKNLRDQSQVLHLSRQLYPGDTKFFQEVFKLATEEKYGHLILDLKQKSNNSLRLRSLDFSTGNIYVYIKK
jgi:hypothetical protein